MAVFVLGKHKEPLMPCSEKRGRLLLDRGSARIHRMYPFTIRLVNRDGGETQPLALKLDPGSKQTGIALVRAAATTATVVALIKLKHRGATIRKALKQRSNFRRRRRSANLRYRTPGGVKTVEEGLARAIAAASCRYRYCYHRAFACVGPVTNIVQESVRFDTQLMENPEISGIEYQQGTLVGCEVREYLLEKWSHKCAYCNAEDVPLNTDHVRPRSRGGSDR